MTAHNPLHIGYFSMEIGLRSDIKQYAGGLGILAGDTLKTAADMGLEMAGVSLLYKHGYFRQTFDQNGIQLEAPDDWDYQKILTHTGKSVVVEMADGPVRADIWRYDVVGAGGAVVPVYFLDADLAGNNQETRYISSNLYTPYQQTRLRQEVLLGIGGVLALAEMGHQTTQFHLNESHAAFAVLALAEKLGSLEAVREHVVFTTHTPAEHGHVQYHKDVLAGVLAPKYLAQLAPDWENDTLHLTKFCLKHSHAANAVAKRHGEVSRKMFPDFKIEAITNGVHLATWASEATTTLLNQRVPGWQSKPELLAEGACAISDSDIAAAHSTNKVALLRYIAAAGKTFAPDIFTIGFGRRVDGYKRSGLLLSQLGVLTEIAQRAGGLQVVMAGKAYFDYGPAENLIAQIRSEASLDLGPLQIVFLDNYDMDIAKLMVAGCDVWLNNPLKPLEACGTSGMKAALNGVPNFSTLDGWWVEGHEEGVTGWSIGCAGFTHNDDDLDRYDLYAKLEHVILPLFQRNKTAWAQIQKNTIAKNASYFNTRRMLGEYLEKAYQT